MSTTDKVFSVSRHSPSPVRIVRAQMRHQGGSAGEILGRKLARSDPQPWWGREGQVGTARRSRAPSFLAARHPPLCPRLRRGVLTARISFSGACSLGRLRRCMPMRSAVFLTGCTISTPPATGVRSQDATRASGSTLAPTCARKWKIANGASTTRGSARQDRRCSQEDRFQLCRMLLPAGEPKQIEPYHTTAKRCLIATAAVAEPRSYPCSCFNTQ